MKSVRINKIGSKKNSLFKNFLYAVEDNNLALIKEILSNPDFNPCINYSKVLVSAVNNARYNIVKILLEDGRVDPTVFNYSTLKIAAENGNSKILSILLKQKSMNPFDDDFYALELAAINNKLECFKLLHRLNGFDKNYIINSVKEAICKGNIDIVKHALKFKEKEKNIQCKSKFLFKVAISIGNFEIANYIEKERKKGFYDNQEGYIKEFGLELYKKYKLFCISKKIKTF